MVRQRLHQFLIFVIMYLEQVKKLQQVIKSKPDDKGKAFRKEAAQSYGSKPLRGMIARLPNQDYILLKPIFIVSVKTGPATEADLS